MRRALVLLVSAFVLVPAAPAGAVWVRARSVAGPARIVRVGDASLAPDGTGVVTYVARVGDRRRHDRDRVGVAVRLRGGRWERSRVLARGAVADIQAAAGRDGRLAVAWIAGGSVWGTVSDHGAVAAAVRLGTGHASGLDVRVDDAGDGYAVWSQDGTGGRDVRAAAVSRATWTPLGAPLDADPTRSAGSGAGRPRVAVQPNGDGVAAWGERYPDGSEHVFARRLSATDASPAPIELGVPLLGTQPGGSADSPVLDAESGPDAVWIAFRQDIGGRSRSLARRLTAAGAGAPVTLDGGAESRHPVLAVAGENGGVAATGAADGTVLASQLVAGGAFGAPVRVDPGATPSPPAPLVAWAADRGEGAIAYRSPATGGGAAVFGRLAEQDHGFDAQTRLSRSGPGPVLDGSLRIGAAPTGDAIVAMVQGARSDRRRVTVALADREPDRPAVTGGWVAGPRPRLRWTPRVDVLGPQRFRVALDGRHVTTTRNHSVRLRHAVRDGRHRVGVTAVDDHGQASRTTTRTVRVDSTPPSLTVTSSRSGRTLRLGVRRSDSGSGVATIVVRWGDGSRSTGPRGPFRHRYADASPRRVTVTVRDRAGNRTVRRLTA